MEATKQHISLETGKLLRFCGVKNSLVFTNECDYEYLDNGFTIVKPKENKYIVLKLFRERFDLRVGIEYPAFTWQEILWEYPDKFFGDNPITNNYKSINDKKIYWYKTKFILNLLQKNEYTNADLYFRKNCILIK